MLHKYEEIDEGLSWAIAGNWVWRAAFPPSYFLTDNDIHRNSASDMKLNFQVNFRRLQEGMPPVQDMSGWVVQTQAQVEGLEIGAKITVNSFADTVVSLGTLGIYESADLGGWARLTNLATILLGASPGAYSNLE